MNRNERRRQQAARVQQVLDSDGPRDRRVKALLDLTGSMRGPNVVLYAQHPKAGKANADRLPAEELEWLADQEWVSKRAHYYTDDGDDAREAYQETDEGTGEAYWCDKATGCELTSREVRAIAFAYVTTAKTDALRPQHQSADEALDGIAKLLRRHSLGEFEKLREISALVARTGRKVR